MLLGSPPRLVAEHVLEVRLIDLAHGRA